MGFLIGSRTYLVALALGGVSAARYMGWITPELAATIETFLIGGGLAALRSAVKP